MRHTEFRPPAGLRATIAPTERVDGRWLRGEVQDPTAARMGGVAGHAGLFATARDLARYAQALMRGGTLRSPTARQRLLAQTTVRLMVQSDRVAVDRFRALGWDLAAPFVADRSSLPPFGAFGHLGYTGTSLWIDPARDLFVIILTSRLYPDGRGNAQPLRNGIADLLSVASVTASASDPPLPRAGLRADIGQPVKTGADVLAADHFAELQGLRVGLITNQTGMTASGERLIDALHRARGVRLVALFSPEHGLQGRLDERVADSTDAGTGLPVFSLYGTVKRPTDAMLRGLDALVFDVQDSGTRFFTYMTTMAYAMQAAARHHLRFFVLDRPDPINAAIVDGPVLDEDLRSFTGFLSHAAAARNDDW